ncbi:MAG: hypothetical protein IPH44_27985 [Myxococcales bacterium]|nr:hypothetical protein [Myxococcales bacterium]MBK7196159.1 hypothetical protein [Myxococcales bacterium]MBP6845806.1 hypothetical protein [Kofleriaceae bacterium]
MAVARGLTSLALIALAAGACTDGGPQALDGPLELACSVRTERYVPPSGRLDLLIVVDRTPSAAALDASLAAVADELVTFEGRDVRVAIVTSELGAAVPGCSADRTVPALPDPRRCGVDGDYLDLAASTRNYVDPLADVLACLLDVPRSTCAVSQPLAAATAALDGSLPALRVFQRANHADLGVLIITDGDDCSLARPDALGAIAGDDTAVDAACFARGVICDGDAPTVPGAKAGCRPRTGAGLQDPIATAAALQARGGVHIGGLGVVAGDATVVVTAAGALAPACTAGAPLGPAVRLRALPGRGVGFSTCTTIGSAWLAMLAPFLIHPIGTCAPRGIDLDPTQPGAQAVCTATAGGEVLAACDAPTRDPARPCYRFGVDPAQCGDQPTLRIELGTELITAYLAAIECEVTCP